MAKKTKKQKTRRRKGKPLSQKLREKDEAREELDRQLAMEAEDFEDEPEEAEQDAPDSADLDAADLDAADLDAADDDAADEDFEDDEDEDDDEGSSFEDDLATLEDPEEGAPLSSYDEDDEEYDEDDDELGAAAAQMGHQRYVMAGFFGLWIVVSYIFGQALELAWSRFASTDWFVANLPQLAAVPHEGELISRASLSLVLGGILGAAIVLRYYFKPDIRTWADEVAEELSHVKWPNRKEVGNHTVVVIIASSIITLYLWLLDQFWSFATNLIYQSGA